MPIYAYRCSACGHAQDVLQKISAPLLTVCPACGQSTYAKQVTAAGFQLKGSGWYVTDFRDGNKAPAAAKTGDKAADTGPGGAPAGSSASPGSPDPAAPAAPTAASPVPAASPAPAPSAHPAAKPAASPPASGT